MGGYGRVPWRIPVHGSTIREVLKYLLTVCIHPHVHSTTRRFRWEGETLQYIHETVPVLMVTSMNDVNWF
jgi:hypothetical protein